jgi:mannose-6-phosphate isomerase-like protein (cupin superfamily)
MCVAIAALGVSVGAQQRRGAKPAGSVTFAIVVTDPSGAPVPNVTVTLQGPEQRTVRTEGNRIALENLPAGAYRLRFEREGFTPLERELTARGAAPIDVKVTLTPLPPPPPPPAPPMPAEKPKATSGVGGKASSADLLAVIDKEFVGRKAGKTTPLACGGAGAATLIQINDPVADHAHADSDEFLYVIAGEGAASVEGVAQKLRAGMLLFVPRGVTHRFSQSGRNPLIILSTRAGEGCSGG